MRFSLWILVAVVGLLLVGVLPTTEGPIDDAIFRSPVLIALLAALALGCLACCVSLLMRTRTRGALTLSRAGFFLTHASIVLILTGALLKFLYGQEGDFVLHLGDPDPTSQSYARDISLDFSLSATDLEISYYEPTHYDRFVQPEATSSRDVEYEFSQRSPIPSDGGPLAIGEEMSVALSELRDESGNWKPLHYLGDGSILQINRAVRHYSAVLHVSTEDGPPISREIAVNHPVSFRAWRFYLMDAKEGQPYLVLSGKKDPGWPLVRAGIWMMLAGVGIMCFRKAGKD